MRRLFAFTALLFCTASCTSGVSTKNCLPLKKWSKQQQIEAATDLGNLPSGSVVFPMIDDYWDLHKRTEACYGLKEPNHKGQDIPFLPE